MGGGPLKPVLSCSCCLAQDCVVLCQTGRRSTPRTQAQEPKHGEAGQFATFCAAREWVDEMTFHSLLMHDVAG